MSNIKFKKAIDIVFNKLMNMSNEEFKKRT